MQRSPPEYQVNTAPFTPYPPVISYCIGPSYATLSTRIVMFPSTVTLIFDGHRTCTTGSRMTSTSVPPGMTPEISLVSLPSTSAPVRQKNHVDTGYSIRYIRLKRSQIHPFFYAPYT